MDRQQEEVGLGRDKKEDRCVVYCRMPRFLFARLSQLAQSEARTLPGMIRFLILKAPVPPGDHQ
jgi:hypothetical protein